MTICRQYTSHHVDLSTFLMRLPCSFGLFDLQLSGHAHRGQIFPFSLITHLVYPMQSGLYKLSNGGSLYTSRGTGTWGPPMRFLSPPEVTIIEVHSGP